MFRPWTVRSLPLCFCTAMTLTVLQVNLDPSTLKKTNSLLLHFKSAKLIAKELEAKHGRVRAGSCNLGDPSRVYVRKAQYHWRWDWVRRNMVYVRLC